MQQNVRVEVTKQFDDGRGIRMPRRIFDVPAYVADQWLRRDVVVLVIKKKSRKLAHLPSKARS